MGTWGPKVLGGYNPIFIEVISKYIIIYHLGDYIIGKMVNPYE